MAVTKLREAKKRSYVCAETGAVINIGDKYWDSNEKVEEKKPFPTRKFCKEVGDRKLKEQTTKE